MEWRFEKRQTGTTVFLDGTSRPIIQSFIVAEDGTEMSFIEARNEWFCDLLSSGVQINFTAFGLVKLGNLPTLAPVCVITANPRRASRSLSEDEIAEIKRTIIEALSVLHRFSKEAGANAPSEYRFLNQQFANAPLPPRSH